MGSRKNRILVIDYDSESIAVINDYANRVLDKITVYSSLSGNEAIDKAIEISPDIIFLNINLPDFSAFEICRNIKNDSRLENIQVVFLTDINTQKESKSKALESGADGFLIKPIDLSELTALIKSLLRINNSGNRKFVDETDLTISIETRLEKLQNELAEKQIIEKLLREKEHTYELVLNNVNEIIYSVSYEKGTSIGKAKFVSNKVVDIIGYHPEEFINNPKLWFNLIHHDDIEEVVKQTQRGFENGKIDIRFYRMKHKNTQEYIWIEDHSELIFDESGNLTGQFGAALDITSRKKAEIEFNENFNFTNSLLKTIPLGIDIVDTEGNILFKNEILEKLSDKPFVYHKCWENYSSDHLQCEGCPLKSEIVIGETSIKESSSILNGRIFEISHTGIMFQGKKALIEVFHDITERKKAEQEFKDISQRFSDLVSSTDGIIWEADAETFQFNFVSNNVERILGYSESEWLESNFWSTNILDEDRKSSIDFCKEQTIKGIDHEFEYRFKAKDGRIVWLADYVKVIKQNGKPRYLHGLMVDITTRKQAEIDMQEREERYRSFISQVSEGVYRFECDLPMDVNIPVEEQIDYMYDHFYIAECNDSFVKMYGVAGQHEIIGKSQLDFHGDRNNAINRKALRDFISSGYRVEGVITQERDIYGKKLSFLNNSLGIIKDGKLVRMWGTQTDVTEKNRAELVKDILFAISKSALEKNNLSELLEIIQEQLGRLINSKNLYIAFYNKETGMLSTENENDEKDSIQEWPAEKSITGYLIKSEESLFLSLNDIEKLIDEGEIVLIGTICKQWLGAPLFVNKEVIGAIVVQSYENDNEFDVNDKQMLEFIAHQISIPIERKIKDNELLNALTKAQESDRLKSAFLANMSHEIRTPLNSIIGFSELMQDEHFDRADFPEFALMISKSGHSLLEIISDIMDISKIEVGQVKISKFEFKLSNLLEQLHKTYCLTANQKGLELILINECPKDILIVNDENRITQVLTNFISNAIKFTNSGKIVLGARLIEQSKQTVVFYVSDSGIGIDSGFKRSIFDRFVQAETFTKRKYGGTGLGLAISKSLAELMGGKIWFDSEIDIGSTFYLELPLD